MPGTWNSVARRFEGVALRLLAIVSLVLALSWVAYTALPQKHGRTTSIDVLWPTYTPQKVRFGEHLAAEFMRLNPDINVNLILTNEPERKLQVMLAGRTEPDVIWMGVGWQQFAEALMPLDDRVAADPETRADNYPPSLWKSLQWKGSLRMLPISAQTGVIYYNKDLFDQAGLKYPTPDWTWDDMVAAAKALTRDFDGGGAIDQYGVQLEGLFRYPFLLYGGQIADSDWRTARIDTPINAYVMNRYRDLIYKDRVMPTPSATAELGILPLFESGRAAMHAATGYPLESFRKVGFDWDIVTMPWIDFEGKRYRATGLWHEEMGILSTTDAPEAAWRFARWCVGRETMAWASREGHAVPGRYDVARSTDFLNPHLRPAHLNHFLESMDFAMPVMPHPRASEVRVEFEPIWQQFMEGSEGRRITAKDALGRMNSVLQTILDNYRAEYR